MTDERQAATRRDLAEQNIDKIFPAGFAADRDDEQVMLPATVAVTPRPTFGVDAAEIDAAKMLSMCGPLIPPWLRNNVGQCWGIIQLSKRWTRYDRITNSWIHFEPLTIASSSYLVRQQDGTETVAFMSIFIRALIDAFGNLQKVLRYAYGGEGEQRTCTCYGLKRGETEIHAYTTPALKLIHPKKSPLWQSDPDRQLAYYASRAWARLYAAGVMNGVYDFDEIEGDKIERSTQIAGPFLPSTGLHERLRQAQAAAPQATPTEGFREGGVEEALQDPPPSAPERRVRAKKTKPAVEDRPAGKTRPSARPRAAEGISSEDAEPEPEPQEPPKQPEPPKNLSEYREHLRRWLMEYKTEQAITERFASERNLRNRCGVTADDRDAMRAEYINPRIQALRSADDEEEREE